MPRYFFHVVNGEFIPDPDGVECANEDQVKAEAVRITGAMIEDQGIDLWKTQRFDMFVCDDKNHTQFKLSFAVEDLRHRGDR
jgi:hypothetical protein